MCLCMSFQGPQLFVVIARESPARLVQSKGKEDQPHAKKTMWIAVVSMVNPTRHSLGTSRGAAVEDREGLSQEPEGSGAGRRGKLRVHETSGTFLSLLLKFWFSLNIFCLNLNHCFSRAM